VTDSGSARPRPTARLAPVARLPDGVTVGHWTDRTGWTGCTAILGPEGCVSAGEIRGGGPGTREFDLLSPATSTPGAQAIVLAGGSAFGLAAAEGAVAWMRERDIGFHAPNATIPLVAGAVVYDLLLGDPSAYPDAAAGYAACEAAGPELERGSVGAGTGCTAGKLLGPDHWTKSGFGAASELAGDALVTALAVANPIGDVIGPDGRVAAGVWRDGDWQPTVDLVRAGTGFASGEREATTLVCILTDAQLSKTEAWKIARAGTAGLARAIAPCATALDGDLVTCLGTGRVPADPFVLEVVAAEAVAAAIRDAAAQATAAPGCPTAAERLAA